MPKDILDLWRAERRSVGQVVLNPFHPVRNGQHDRQMVKRVLPDQPNEVFGGVKAGGIDRRMEKVHGDPQGQGNFCQQRGQRGFHGIAMNGTVIQNEDDLAEAALGIAQDDQGEHGDDVLGFGLPLKVDRGLTTAQVHREKAILPDALLFVARQGRCRVFFRPGVMGTGGGREGKFIHGYDGGVRAGGEVFFNAATNSARCPGREGP